MFDYTEELLPKFHCLVYDAIGDISFYVYRNTPIQYPEAENLVWSFMGRRCGEMGYEEAYSLCSPVILTHQEDGQLIPIHLVTLEQQQTQQTKRMQRMEQIRKRHEHEG